MINPYKVDQSGEQWRSDILQMAMVAMMLAMAMVVIGELIFAADIRLIMPAFIVGFSTCAASFTLSKFNQKSKALWCFTVFGVIANSLLVKLEGDPNNFILITGAILGIVLISLVGEPKHAIANCILHSASNLILTYLIINNYIATSVEVSWSSSFGAVIILIGALIPLVFSSIVVNSIIKQLRESNHQLSKEVEARKEAEKEVQSQVAWFQEVLDSSPDIFYVFDQNGQLNDINRTGCDKLGYSKEEILGKSIEEIDADWDPLKMQEEAESQMKAGSNAILLGRQFRKDGTIFPVEIAVSILMYDGEHKRVGFARDITNRLKADEALQQSEEKFRTIYNTTSVGMYIMSNEGVLIDVNDRWLEMTGYERDELIGQKSINFLTPESQKQAAEVEFPLFIKRGYMNDRPFQVVRKSGEIFDILFSCKMRQSEDGSFIGLLASIVDVTEQNHLKNIALQNEKKFRALFNHSTDFTLVLSPDGTILDSNNRSEAIGLNGREGFIGFKVWEATGLSEVPHAQKLLREMLTKISEDGTVQRGEIEVFVSKFNLGQVFIDIILTPVFNNANSLETIIIEGRDITTLVQTREALRQSADDNKVLLQEVHHRVKNNLQIITSMLRMELRATPDDLLKTSFQEIMIRVQSMSLIHQQLYQRNKNLGEIELDLYMNQLLKEVNRIYRLNVDTKIDVSSIQLDIDRALTCGLIVNELATNAMKYAFPNKTGTLQIIGRQENESVHLEVIDDGIGLPEEIDFENATSTGFQLINLMNHQLSGDISITREKGTRFELTFPFNNT